MSAKLKLKLLQRFQSEKFSIKSTAPHNGGKIKVRLVSTELLGAKSAAVSRM